jgi:hypothetical protein
MGHEYNQKMFFIHISSIFHGVLVYIGQCYFCVKFQSKVTQKKGYEKPWKEFLFNFVTLLEIKGVNLQIVGFTISGFDSWSHSWTYAWSVEVLSNERKYQWVASRFVMLWVFSLSLKSLM